eukprot:768753-Hanusia_phi.AAC.1
MQESEKRDYSCFCRETYPLHLVSLFGIFSQQSARASHEQTFTLIALVGALGLPENVLSKHSEAAKAREETNSMPHSLLHRSRLGAVVGLHS